MYIYSKPSRTAVQDSFNLSGQRRKQVVGELTWGRGPTSAWLFASSEPQNGFSGFHKAFDVGSRKVALDLDASGAGDAMAVTEDGKITFLPSLAPLSVALGDKLTLCTREDACLHRLWLYDVRRGNSNAILTMTLKPFDAGMEGEVLCAAFRNDGIYLALGRNDDHIHVYDSRMQDRLLFDYSHSGPCRTHPGNTPYGVAHIEWADNFSTGTSASGLVMGGSDGQLCYLF